MEYEINPLLGDDSQAAISFLCRKCTEGMKAVPNVSILEYTVIYKSILEYTGIYKSILEYTEVYWNILECKL